MSSTEMALYPGKDQVTNKLLCPRPQGGKRQSALNRAGNALVALGGGTDNQSSLKGLGHNTAEAGSGASSGRAKHLAYHPESS